jgi:hypothetical protein
MAAEGMTHNRIYCTGEYEEWKLSDTYLSAMLFFGSKCISVLEFADS